LFSVCCLVDSSGCGLILFSLSRRPTESRSKFEFRAITSQNYDQSTSSRSLSPSSHPVSLGTENQKSPKNSPIQTIENVTPFALPLPACARAEAMSSLGLFLRQSYAFTCSRDPRGVNSLNTASHRLDLTDRSPSCRSKQPIVAERQGFQP